MEAKLNLLTDISLLHADICSGLADPTRILILYLLSEQPLTVGEITSRLNIFQPTTSRHLKILRERGMVRTNRQAQKVEYFLSDARIIEALDILRAVLRDSIAQRANLLTNQQSGEQPEKILEALYSD